MNPAEADKLLAEIRDATADMEAALVRRLAAIKAARAAELPVAHIARAAGLSRQSIYQMTRE